MNVDEEKVNQTILKWSVLSGVANINPVLGADVAGVVGCQLRMFYKIAEYYDVQVTKERFWELLSTLAAGVGGWAVTIFGAAAMLKLFPGIGNVLLYWQPPVVAAFTWAMGHVLKGYFPGIKEGKSWDKGDLQVAMRNALQDAKKIDWKKELASSSKLTEEQRFPNVPIALHEEANADDHKETVVPKSSPRNRVSMGICWIVVHPDSRETTSDLIKLRQNGPRLELVAYSEARDKRKFRMQFPIHHPQENFLYISHPFKPVCYLRPEFHRCLFHDKVTELLTLLRALGATRIKIVVKEGYKVDTSIIGKARVPAGLATIKPQGTFDIARETNEKTTWKEEHSIIKIPTFQERVWSGISMNRTGSE
jgi:uncharacterized protein (DUF697 family)